MHLARAAIVAGVATINTNGLRVSFYVFFSCQSYHITPLQYGLPARLWKPRNVMVGPKHTEAPRTPAARKSFSVRFTAGQIVYDEVRHLCSNTR